VNRTQALTILKRVIGKHLAYREDSSALVGEELEAAQGILEDANTAYAVAKKACDERRAALLAGDAEYQRLKTASTRAYEAAGKACANAHRRRITVGDTSNGLFFSVKAEGDNWQEVVDILTKNKAAA
jgi:hypothetical protein